MTASCGWIGALVLRVQDAFLEHPRLELTPSAAQRRFGADEVACRAVLSALADAGVLSRTRGGAFVRRVPAVQAGRSRPAHRRTTARPRLEPVHAA